MHLYKLAAIYYKIKLIKVHVVYQTSMVNNLPGVLCLEYISIIIQVLWLFVEDLGEDSLIVSRRNLILF